MFFFAIGKKIATAFQNMKHAVANSSGFSIAWCNQADRVWEIVFCCFLNGKNVQISAVKRKNVFNKEIRIAIVVYGFHDHTQCRRWQYNCLACP